MTGSHVTVRLTAGVAGLAGLSTCGSVWACPVCNAKIMARRAVEIGDAVRTWQAKNNAVAFGTFTMLHRSGQRLSDLWDALAKAWNRVTGGAGWKANQRKYGVAGWLRVVEVTVGKNGWHVHVHVLLFVNGSIAPLALAELQASMFDRWAAALFAAGLEMPLAVGQDMHLITGAGDASLSEYFTKATDNAHRVGLEFTQTQSKTTRTAHSTASVWSILDDLLNTGEVEHLDRWHEWERSSKGRKQLTWSKGLRALVELEKERNDEQIADEELGSSRDDLVAITAAGWSQIVGRQDQVAEMLNVTESSGLDGLVAFLQALDVEHEVVGHR